jgi:hypothetical protein
MTKSTSKQTKEIWGNRIPTQEQKGFSNKRWLQENNLQLSPLYYRVKKLSLKSPRVLKKCDNLKNLNPLLVEFLEERC